jgi:hypothetical protein
MVSKHTRTLLFWGACIPVRTYAATRGDVAWLRLAALVIGVRWVAGFETAHVGAFGGPAWWANERGAHGVLWLAYAATGDARYLRLDVALGAANWVVKSQV